MSMRHRRPWAKSPTSCVSARYAPQAGQSHPSNTAHLLQKPGLQAVFSQPSLGPMAASQRHRRVGLTAIIMAIYVMIHSCEERLVQWWRTNALMVQTCRLMMCFCARQILLRPGPPAPFFLCAKRQKGRLERNAEQASGPLHHSSGGGRLAGQTNGTATGAGPWHCQRWSHEAKNGHSGCQRGRLDGRTESDPSEQNDTMRSHGTFLHFDLPFTGFASRAAPPKTVPRG
jgi:hypothetical protein